MVFFATRGLLGPSGTNAGDIDVGTEVLLNENGQPVNYLVVNQGIPENSPLYDASCEGTWLFRKSCEGLENQVWNSGHNTLNGSTIMTAMAGYLDDYDPAVQEAIKKVKIPYCVGDGNRTINSGANGLECKIFPLSGVELGCNSGIGLPSDGAKLDYFISGNGEDAKIRRLDTDRVYYTRSPVYSGNTPVYYILTNGSWEYNSCNVARGSRPALILPYEFKFQDDQIAA